MPSPRSGSGATRHSQSRSSSSGSFARKGWCSCVILLAFCCIVTFQLVVFPGIVSLATTNNNNDDNNKQDSATFPIAALKGGRGSLKQQQRKRQRRRASPASATDDSHNDGTFNNAPVRLRHKVGGTYQSRVHCVGEDYHPHAAWQQRSCHFEFLCYNTSSHDFVVFLSSTDRQLAEQLMQRPTMHVSDSMFRYNATNAVALGGINLKWGKPGVPRIKWFPKIISLRPEETRGITYYELPASTVLLPYHSMNGANPGHLIWDDFLPMFTVLKMFRLSDLDLLPLRFVLQDGERGLWASCDLRRDKLDACNHMMRKFWPLLDTARYNLTSTLDAVLRETAASPQSNLVCAQHGAAGLGPLTDHGVQKMHGWEEPDYQSVHNAGRGGTLYEFRNFMVENLLGIDPLQPVSLEKPLRIVFSINSSEIFNRKMDFAEQIQAVKAAFPNESVETYTLRELTLHEQVELAASTAVFVTLCGGGAVTGMFLPIGSSVFLYYAEDGGTRNGKMNHKPALLDWDLFNAMSHLRVHWMPRNTMKHDNNLLIMLIQHELELIRSRSFLV